MRRIPGRRFVCAFFVAACTTVTQRMVPAVAQPLSQRAECRALRTLESELAKYGDVKLLSIETIAMAGSWALVGFSWGGAGGDALLVRNGDAWSLRRQGGGEMSEPILVAFGVDPTSAVTLRTTQKAPSRCTVATTRPSPKPTPARPPSTPRPVPTETRIPGDHPLGTMYPMLITTIENRIQCLQKFADDEPQADVGKWPGYLEDSINDGQRGAPHDPALPRFIYGMQIYYKKAHDDGDAARMRSWLRTNYPNSKQNAKSLSQIDADAKRPVICHMTVREFDKAPLKKTP